jgi:hypothetical protein
MGLNIEEARKSLYSYSDQYSEVVYRQLFTAEHENSEHGTDGLSVPLLAVYTRPASNTDFRYVGYVSDMYQFIGNDVLCQKIRESIQSVGTPILTENVIMTFDHTRMRNEIIIQSSQNHPQAGDVFPVMVINNSYNGTHAATIAFGIAMDYNNNSRTVFAFSLGEMRQVHIQSSSTEMSSAISSYMQSFSENITGLISQNFDNPVTEDSMMSLLELIESYGKKRKDAITAILQELQPAEAGLPSAWQVFLSIVRYSSFEPNLNIKRLLENAAESVLVIPQRMNEVLERLQTS